MKTCNDVLTLNNFKFTPASKGLESSGGEIVWTLGLKDTDDLECCFAARRAGSTSGSVLSADLGE